MAATRFTDVPVVDPSKESGETVAIESNCVQGACIEARMLSAFTCVFRKLSASEAAARKTELEAQEKRRKRRQRMGPKGTAGRSIFADIGNPRTEVTEN